MEKESAIKILSSSKNRGRISGQRGGAIDNAHTLGLYVLLYSHSMLRAAAAAAAQYLTGAGLYATLCKVYSFIMR